jgi:glycine/D-amino acid oxidase-like deaminating enzyme
MAAETDVAVMGSGVTAGAVAWELARTGLRPLLVAQDGAQEIGHVATGPAMAYAEVARRIGREAAREVWAAYRESRERLRSFLAGLPHDCGYRQPGAFLLALERDGAALLADSEDMLREDGFAGEFLDHYMLETRLPLFGFAGGYWAADDAELDASRLADALRRSAEDRGASVADVGAVREVVTDAGAVEVVGDRGRVRAGHVVLTEASTLSSIGRTGMTRTATVIEADVVEGLELPSLARSGDARFRWHSAEAVLRLEAHADLDVEDLLARLTVRGPSVRGRTTVLAVEDRLPLVGPLLEGSTLALACSSEPCGIAFGAARGVAEWLKTGRDPTPRPFRAARKGGAAPASA